MFVRCESGVCRNRKWVCACYSIHAKTCTVCSDRRRADPRDRRAITRALTSDESGRLRRHEDVADLGCTDLDLPCCTCSAGSQARDRRAEPRACAQRESRPGVGDRLDGSYTRMVYSTSGQHHCRYDPGSVHDSGRVSRAPARVTSGDPAGMRSVPRSSTLSRASTGCSAPHRSMAARRPSSLSGGGLITSLPFT